MDKVDRVYPLAGVFWRGEDVRVCDVAGSRLLAVPIAFMLRGGQSTYRYIFEQTQATYDGQGILCDSDKQAIDLDRAVKPGTVIYVPVGDSAIVPKRGPRFKYKYKAPSGEAGSSTMSNSGRSSPGQSQFMLRVAARDGVCIISGVPVGLCIAAHILPASRPEYYAEVLGTVYDQFQPSCGLLLRSELHTTFDKGDWALYPEQDAFVVHEFVFEENQPRYHGKRITKDYFRGPTNTFPDTRLLRFHYDQCAMMHLRGFASQMSGTIDGRSNGLEE